jgi:hypothetical protein
MDGPGSLTDVDPELLRTYERLGIPLRPVFADDGKWVGPHSVNNRAFFAALAKATEDGLKRWGLKAGMGEKGGPDGSTFPPGASPRLDRRR